MRTSNTLKTFNQNFNKGAAGAGQDTKGTSGGKTKLKNEKKEEKNGG
jgi:hypothetical protein